jgi:hypothetical protein
MLNHLYEIPVEVRLSKKSDTLIDCSSSLVNCYVSARDHKKALKYAVKCLKQDNYIFVDVISEIREIDPNKWNDFINLGWKEFSNFFPSQDRVLEIVQEGNEGGVFYSPFMAYDSKNSS